MFSSLTIRLKVSFLKISAGSQQGNVQLNSESEDLFKLRSNPKVDFLPSWKGLTSELFSSCVSWLTLLGIDPKPPKEKSFPKSGHGMSSHGFSIVDRKPLSRYSHCVRLYPICVSSHPRAVHQWKYMCERNSWTGRLLPAAFRAHEFVTKLSLRSSPNIPAENCSLRAKSIKQEDHSYTTSIKSLCFWYEKMWKTFAVWSFLHFKMEVASMQFCKTIQYFATFLSNVSVFIRWFSFVRPKMSIIMFLRMSPLFSSLPFSEVCE